MPTKSQAPPDLIDRIQAIEDIADRCYERLDLLEQPWNVIAWCGLINCASILEELPRVAYGTQTHRIMLINLSRIFPILYRWSREHGNPKTAPVSKFHWTRARMRSTQEAFNIAHHYFGFCATFPGWHRDLLSAELFTPNGVVFLGLADRQARRVSAYQKGIGGAATEALPPVPVTHEMEALIRATLETIKAKKLQIAFPRPDRLLRYLNELYQSRLQAAFRRFEGITLGQFSLGEFRRFFAALTSIAAAQENICFRWSLNRRYPIDSSVLHYPRQHWIDLLSDLSGVEDDIVSDMIDDLTLGSTNIRDLILHPFVSLDDDGRRLGLLPHFVLNAPPQQLFSQI
jgi:hypothetical protein